MTAVTSPIEQPIANPVIVSNAVDEKCPLNSDHEAIPSSHISEGDGISQAGTSNTLITTSQIMNKRMRTKKGLHPFEIQVLILYISPLSRSFRSHPAGTIL